MIPREVSAWLEQQGYGSVTSERSVGGGCINNGVQLRTSSGKPFFLKTNASCPADMFAREAEGLAELHVPGGPRVPQPYLHGQHYLLLEDLQPSRRASDYWERFGRQMASLHNHTRSEFGFHHDNYIGSTPQPNPGCPNGYTFFAEHRLIYQARLARDRGLVDGRTLHQVEGLAARLPELIPHQPASLVHGDLWSGNALADADGNPAIIDPATHYGWAEAELAMTTLFGSFSDEFYQEYQEVRPLDKGFRERFPIYNLYHLLNHVNLFGGGYMGSVISVLRKYG